MIKESDIQNYLYARNIPYTDHASIYAVILPKYSFMRTMMATMLEVQHFVIHFGRTGISVIVVNDLTGRLDPYGFLFFPGERIQSVQFFRRVTHDQLVIQLTDGVRVYRVNKRMMMLPWHKSNLKALTYKSPVYYNQC